MRKFQAYFDADLYAEVKKYADRETRSVNNMLAVMVKEYLQRRGDYIKTEEA